MTMLEKVEEALIKACEEQGLGAWGGELIHINALRALARAGIEAMREPTQAMIKAAQSYDMDDPSSDISWNLNPDDVAQIMGRMIDAALKEQP